MKKTIFFALLVFLTTLQVFAQTAATGTAAKITFTESSFDFGDIYQGAKVTHTFKFKNSGKAPLVISNVRTTCGCTAPKWPREPLAPGEEGEIIVEFNSAGKMGKQNKVITIISNAENANEAISIVTNVLPPKGTN